MGYRIPGVSGGHKTATRSLAGHQRYAGCLENSGKDLRRRPPMIISRSPMRVSLGGGGTDLPSYYTDHGGFVLSAAIDKYVYITLHETFVAELIVKYSRMEVVDRVEDVKHPIVREALKLVDVGTPHLEITSMSDIPAGSGLGSSGSFTTALLRALHTMKRNSIGRSELA